MGWFNHQLVILLGPITYPLPAGTFESMMKSGILNRVNGGIFVSSIPSQWHVHFLKDGMLNQWIFDLTLTTQHNSNKDLL